MPRTRIAIIGLGMAVAPHAKSLIELSARVEVAAAYSQTPARREAFAAAYGLPTTADLDAVFADPAIDAVMILSPPNTHLDLVRRAAAAGKHVLLEKPLEISIARAEELVATAEEHGITLGLVLQHRFKPASEALNALISSGRLGGLVSASARIQSWRPQSYYDQPGRGTKARDGGGVLLTQAIHILDLLVSLAGLPDEVSAYAATTPIHRMETEDMVAATLHYENGGMGTVNATTCAFPGFPEVIEIIGAKGTAVLEGTALTARFHDGTLFESGREEVGGAGGDPMAFPHHHHLAVLTDFLDAIEQGRRLRIDGREALKVHDLIEAILLSAASGRMEPVRRR